MAHYYSNHHYNSKKEYFQVECVEAVAKTEGNTVLDQSFKGTHGFVLVETNKRKAESGENLRYIAIFKLVKDDGEYGDKSFDETSHPYFYGCPERILKQSNCMHENAVKWREANRQVAKREKSNKDLIIKNKAAMVNGRVYRVGQRDVVFNFHYKPSRFAGYDVNDPGKKVFAFRYEQVNWDHSYEKNENSLSPEMA